MLFVWSRDYSLSPYSANYWMPDLSRRWNWSWTNDKARKIIKELAQYRLAENSMPLTWSILVALELLGLWEQRNGKWLLISYWIIFGYFDVTLAIINLSITISESVMSIFVNTLMKRYVNGCHGIQLTYKRSFVVNVEVRCHDVKTRIILTNIYVIERKSKDLTLNLRLISNIIAQ